MEAYSPDTDTRYPSFDALIAAEANGWVAVAIITNGKETWPWVKGPFPTREDAVRAQRRLRRAMKNESANYPKHTYKVHVRPVWA